MRGYGLELELELGLLLGLGRIGFFVLKLGLGRSGAKKVWVLGWSWEMLKRIAVGVGENWREHFGRV